MQTSTASDPNPSARKGRLPVTVLSGFLGAGKTTLLNHYLVIESTGISEPLPVAETFTFRDGAGVSLSGLARLDTLVTVVDAVSFPTDLERAADLAERGESLGPDDQRTLADLLIDQVEFADVLVVNKIDLVSGAERERLIRALRRLNRHAEILTASFGQVPLDQVIDTGRFDFARAASAPGWLQELRGTHTPETEEYGIAGFVFIGQHLVPEAIAERLDACLLDDTVMAGGPDRWRRLPDPFPAWTRGGAD